MTEAYQAAIASNGAGAKIFLRRLTAHANQTWVYCSVTSLQLTEMEQIGRTTVSPARAERLASAASRLASRNGSYAP